MLENNGYLRQRIVMISLLLLFSGSAAFSQTTTFTYQGRLRDGGSPANGSYDLQFTLWDTSSGGTQQPQPSLKQQQSQIETLRAQNAALNGRLQSVERVLTKRVGSARRRR